VRSRAERSRAVRSRAVVVVEKGSRRTEEEGEYDEGDWYDSEPAISGCTGVQSS
jgi:hypothetical protein